MKNERAGAPYDPGTNQIKEAAPRGIGVQHRRRFLVDIGIIA